MDDMTENIGMTVVDLKNNLLPKIHESLQSKYIVFHIYDEKK